MGGVGRRRLLLNITIANHRSGNALVTRSVHSGFSCILVGSIVDHQNLEMNPTDSSGCRGIIHTIGICCIQVADGMSFLESNGYIHGNLRACNMLLFDCDVVKISGFSLSRDTDEDCNLRDG